MGTTTTQNLPDATAQDKNRNHQVSVWSTGKRGGGSVPADFGWKTNPKQWQEETGAASPKEDPPQRP
jgi:hypothetical protein